MSGVISSRWNLMRPLFTPCGGMSLLKHIYGDAPAAVESSKAYFLKQLDHVEQTLQASGHFLVGGDFASPSILPHYMSRVGGRAQSTTGSRQLPRLSAGACHGADTAYRTALAANQHADPDADLRLGFTLGLKPRPTFHGCLSLRGQKQTSPAKEFDVG